ncbi:MAG: S-adenosyl-L-homocysteine hydrolase [Candidatus Syntrophoarchaeum caldarius]|uniref:S-inosyl-L-homocysteine hydrolase n=1 Tax=Candidatus Syntropharchaeum caldarium TaxID=1838285 RepID=A0A1F2P739_9EURY|nr:MAG: S-adenosyl-L-homocysteine hydrolase [Candidatus Syntrophoarchaeum caldarius]
MENYDEGISMKESIVKDLQLADTGDERIEWARRHMPVLELIKSRFEETKPLDGVKITACLHVTVETANLIKTLKAGGAEIALAGSNPLSTQDDVAAALARSGIWVYAFRENDDEYYACLEAALDIMPDVVLDDGADTIAHIHEHYPDLMNSIKGACEETTTGVIRLRALEKSGKLAFPVIAVNDAETKMMFDNRYGTGQSTLHGIMNATNLLFAGRKVVVVGYGWCGRGVAMRARGLGANVIVVEVNPRKALEAVMDGYQVMPMHDAAKTGEIFITVTGDTSVIRGEHFELMQDQAVLANSGHFNVEIAIDDLEKLAISKKRVKEEVDEYTLADGRRIYLLSEGRLINLAAAYGHPPGVMDMSFANQALAVEYIINSDLRERKVTGVPREIDERVAALKLKSMGIEIETLTEEQERYLSSWELGT